MAKKRAVLGVRLQMGDLDRRHGETKCFEQEVGHWHRHELFELSWAARATPMSRHPSGSADFCERSEEHRRASHDGVTTASVPPAAAHANNGNDELVSRQGLNVREFVHRHCWADVRD